MVWSGFSCCKRQRTLRRFVSFSGHTGLALRWFQRLGPSGSGSLSFASGSYASGSLNQSRCTARDSGAPSFLCALGTARFNLADTGWTGLTVRASQFDVLKE